MEDITNICNTDLCLSNDVVKVKDKFEKKPDKLKKGQI